MGKSAFPTLRRESRIEILVVKGFARRGDGALVGRAHRGGCDRKGLGPQPVASVLHFTPIPRDPHPEPAEARRNRLVRGQSQRLPQPEIVSGVTGSVR